MPSAERPSVLDARDLTKSFGAVRAVREVSFSVREGEIYGLLGPNGAGKTTTISMVCGLLSPDTGSVRIDGKDLGQDPVRAKSIMGYVPQEVAIYEELSALENMRFWGRLYGIAGRELEIRGREVLGRVGLLERAKDVVEKYSGGMKRRLNLAVSLLHRPRLLLLDEPTVGIDPQGRINILEVVREIARSGTAILYTTHYMDEAEKLCDRIAIMDEGRILAEGTLGELVSMLGEGRIVTLHGPFTTQSVEDVLHGQADLKVLSLDAGHCLFLSKRPERITEIIRTLFEAKVPVEDISVRDPSLESLFLRLTGKELRD